jgi:hypothetical protein
MIIIVANFTRFGKARVGQKIGSIIGERSFASNSRELRLRSPTVRRQLFYFGISRTMVNTWRTLGEHWQMQVEFARVRAEFSAKSRTVRRKIF